MVEMGIDHHLVYAHKDYFINVSTGVSNS